MSEKNLSEKSLVSTASAREYFKDLLDGAITNQKVPLGEMTEFYLVELLNKYMDVAALYSQTPEGKVDDEPLAFQLRRALEAAREERVKALRKLGDQSLYVAGFFGDSLGKRLVDIDYYISMGGAAYGALAKMTREAPAGGSFSSLYEELTQKFTAIVDLFSEVSERVSVSTNQGVVRLYERWVKTGSDRLTRLLAEQGLIPTLTKPGTVQ